MEARHSWKLLLALVLLFATSGANCRHVVRQYTEPRTLPEAATLDQIVEKVNTNTSKVISAQSTHATLKAEGIPVSLGANIALMPQRKLHMQASLGGPRIDLGSNDEMFWVWIKDNEPAAIFVCRHDQFAMSNARQLMPIEPERLIEAIGLPHIDPSLVLAPPQIVGANRIEIISRLPSQLGDLKKKTIVDGWNGQVLEQHIYDHMGMTLASSHTSRYKHDPTTGAALPRSIEIQWPTAKMGFKLEVSDWVINQIPPENTALWAVPQSADYPTVDLADPSVQFVNPNAAAGMPSRGSPAVPQVAPPAIAPPVDVPQQPAASFQGLPPNDDAPLPPGPIYPAASHPPSAMNPLR